jgi:hypothetical protein
MTENRNISETPERWVIVKIPYEDDYVYKVYGTWAGDYLDGDRWKLNSGIAKVDKDEDYYYFYGYSGSCYKCHKKGYGYATSYGAVQLEDLIKKAELGGVDIEVMDEKTNWNTLLDLSSKKARKR